MTLCPVAVAKLVVLTYAQESLLSICFRLAALARKYVRHSYQIQLQIGVINWLIDHASLWEQAEAIDICTELLREAEVAASKDDYSVNVVPLMRLHQRLLRR